MSTRRKRAKEAVSILVASDWAPIRAFDEPMRRTPEAVYGNLLPVLRTADLAVVNCECALTRARGSVWKSGSVFKGHPDHVRALTAVPFDVACLANNHVMDYGVAGLRDTLDVLRSHGVSTVGAGLTGEEACRPLSLTAGGVQVHIVNFSEGEDLTASRGGPGVFGWDLTRALHLVSDCRREGGVVLVIAHCGLEYIPYPPPYVAKAFRSMVAAGADCVIGHHPHVPQGVEWYRRRPIVYSLGNFAFYQLTDLFWRRTGLCVKVRCDGGRVEGIDLIPYRIGDAGLRTLDSQETFGFLRTLAQLSGPLSDPTKVEEAWQAYLAYYGVEGFTKEVRTILEKIDAEPPKGAAMFRNRITTMQHRELWRDLLTRIVNGRKRRDRGAVSETIEEYFTRKLDG